MWVVLAIAVLIGVYLVFSSAPRQPAEEPATPSESPTTEKPATPPTSTTAPQGGTIEVAIKGFKFLGETVRVAPGTTIVWKNYDDAPHTIVGADFQSKVLPKGGTYSRTFTKEGTYSYFCGIHPNMKGEIVVRAGAF